MSRTKQRYIDGCRCIAGVVPFREREDGQVEVLCISNCRGDEFILPKGGWETDETAPEAAIRECYEEAGLRGHCVYELGEYAWTSSKGKTQRQWFYAMRVTEELAQWPETERTRRWLLLDDLLQLCTRAGMADALRVFASNLPSILAAEPLPKEGS
eukprot:m.139023 g.139023  ORF g.139023 m.139023 type:complete len:156 (-) comp16645_c0_seq2:2456-2923(-)